MPRKQPSLVRARNIQSRSRRRNHSKDPLKHLTISTWKSVNQTSLQDRANESHETKHIMLFWNSYKKYPDIMQLSQQEHVLRLIH